jgi:hypothetical protein
MGEMRRATAREEEQRKRDGFASTLAISASPIAAVRLAREDISTTVVDRGFRREPGASAPGKSANFECLQARAFAPFLRQEASTTVVLERNQSRYIPDFR